jgi:hypothetical protein
LRLFDLGTQAGDLGGAGATAEQEGAGKQATGKQY